MQRRTLAFLVTAVAAAGSVEAQPAGIDHKAVACIVVAKYPKLKACFGGAVVEPRAYFHAEGVKEWYWVKMATDLKDAPEPYCYAGILPRPSRSLIHRHIEYYLEDVGKGERTREYDPLVVRQARECKKDAPVAPISPTGPTAVFPALPAGFAIGGFPTVAVGVATAAVATTGVVLATRNDKAPPTVTPVPPVPPAPVAPPPPPPTPPPATSPLDLSCQAEPRSGVVPLTVTFTAFASGGTGSYDYAWQFGDGGTGVGRHPVHTYTSTGTFDVLLIVTSGDKVRQCERTITVNAPAPPPPPSNFTLSVVKTGSGSGTVTDDKGKINCGATCSGTYVNGTLVSLSAVPSPASTFIAWSGDCSGTAGCVVTIDRARSVTAQFDISPTPTPTTTLTVTSWNQAGECTPGPDVQTTPPSPPAHCISASPPPGTICTEKYPAGTVVKLTAIPDPGCYDLACWTGDCAFTSSTPGSVCTLTMDTDRSAGVRFVFGSCVTSAEPPVILTWNVDLEAPGAVGQVVMDGQLLVAETGQRVQHASRTREGAVVVSAIIVRADGKFGTWRFEAQEAAAIEPGSLRVQQGDVHLLTPTAVVFRLRGQAGERVTFSYRLRR